MRAIARKKESLDWRAKVKLFEEMRRTRYRGASIP